jgi:hypothetical protein
MNISHSDVASLTNIRGRSKSTRASFIFVGATTKPTNGTDEYIYPNEYAPVSCSDMWHMISLKSWASQ